MYKICSHCGILNQLNAEEICMECLLEMEEDYGKNDEEQDED